MSSERKAGGAGPRLRIVERRDSAEGTRYVIAVEETNIFINVSALNEQEALERAAEVLKRMKFKGSKY
ncbi:MAG: hypothetical protein ABWK00_06320 [Desulfurococcaceae archaeon]